MSKTRQRLQRSLSLLRRLQIGAADRDVLMQWVQRELEYRGYDEEKSDKSLQRQFEDDVRFLREDLGADVPGYDRRRGVYELNGFGRFSPLGLNEMELDTLAFLLRTFGETVPRGAEVSRFLSRVVDLLTEDQQEGLTRRRDRFLLDLRYRDTEEVADQVAVTVERALRERRLLRFAYRTAGQTDGIPRIHTVMPHAQRFDTMRGHLYLDAYWLESDGPLGRHRQERWQPFRVDRIEDDDNLTLLPDRLPPELPPRPRYRLEYWLSPRIARLGQISRHFDDMKVHETDEAGWVRVTGTTDDLFHACQLLLGYGPNCRVTGGSEARTQMERMVKEMGEMYANDFHY